MENTMDFGNGLKLIPHLIDAPLVASSLQRIETIYEKLQAARESGEGTNLKDTVGPNERFLPTASSFTIGAAFSKEHLAEILAAIRRPTAKDWITEQLGDDVVCNLDESWIRRQYAPARYPRFHAPHGWHQDGALGFDFHAHPTGDFPTDALLQMVTCWIALVDCGTDAPGLELLRRRFENLVPPSELQDDQIRNRFASDEIVHPVMEAGDALLFRGDILHRTHVSAAMTKDRTSIELRFFSAEEVPARLRSNRFVCLD